MSNVKIEGNASGTGTFTIAAPNSNTDRTLTLPDNTGTVVYENADGDVAIANGTLYVNGEISAATSNGTSIGFNAPNTFNVNGVGVALYGMTRGDGNDPTAVSLSGYGGLKFYTLNTERMRIDSSGNLKFNSGYGSAATAYGCRAWVNFNGTGTVAIRASGNVSSITDNGTGDYTVNFTTAMPDANYSLIGTTQYDTSGNEANHYLMSLEIKGMATPLTTTSARVVGKYGGSTATYDMNTVSVAIFR